MSPPEILRISSARPPSRLPHHPLLAGAPPFRFSRLGPPSSASSPFPPPHALLVLTPPRMAPHYTKASLRSSEVPPPFQPHPHRPSLELPPSPGWAQGVMQPWATLGTVRGPAAATFQAGATSFALSRGSSGELILRGPHPLRHPVLGTQGEQP